jgi:hypothetical protein
MLTAEAVAKEPGRVGPAPAGFFLTAKIIDDVPGLKTSALGDRVRQILQAAETDLFQPLLVSARLNEFGQDFTLLANRYFPVRLQALLMILNEVGWNEFRTDYFNRAPKVAASFAMQSGHWGLDVKEVADSFRQYFDSALTIISVFPLIGTAPVPALLRLASSLTEIDYGFTAMGLVFEGSIHAQPWRISEVFKLTRRSLLEYEDATRILVEHARQVHPEQREMFASVDRVSKKVVAIGPRALGEAGRHLRNIGRAVAWPNDDPDSDCE